MQGPVQLPQCFILEMKKMMTASPWRVEEVLRIYGREPDALGCNAKNLWSIRDLFIEDYATLRRKFDTLLTGFFAACSLQVLQIILRG